MQKFEFFGHNILDVSFKKGLPNLEKLEAHVNRVKEQSTVHGEVETNLSNDVQKITNIDAAIVEANNVAKVNESFETSQPVFSQNSSHINASYENYLSSIADSLKKLNTETDDKINKFLTYLAETAVLISKSVIDKEFKSVEYYKRLVEEITSAMKKIEKNYTVTIKVNSKHKESLLNDFSSNTYLTNNLQYKIVFDDNLTEYDSIVEWEDGKMENILQNKINQLESIIMEHLVGLDKTYGNN